MRVCVIGAGPCGLAALKNLLQAGCQDVVCYEEHDAIGGNWAFTDDPGRVSVHEGTHLISSRAMSAFDGFPMPRHYPDFPSHAQMLAYFTGYARAFGLERHIRLRSHVEQCTLRDDGRWAVRVNGLGVELFDTLLVCSGHHREAFIPLYPGGFAGQIVHSCAYKRPDPFRGKRVLVVGAGNSAADIAADIARVAARAAISMREGAYVIPKLMFGRPIDTVYAFWAARIPRPMLRSALKLWLRFAVGAWEAYGLQAPAYPPLQKHPTLNSGVLEALRHGRLAAQRGIQRYDGHTVHFTDGTRDDFDAIIMATGFRVSFPFLPHTATKPLYLNMMHPGIPSLYFIGLFQPIGCIWRLADHQARIAALQIAGRLSRPPGVDARIYRDVTQPRGLEVDYHSFRRALAAELATAATT